MSKKIAIVCDSAGSLTDEMIKKYDIKTSYLMIIFGVESFEEFKELSPSEFVSKCAAQTELPSTSQPAIGVTSKLYESIFAEGYEEIIHISISSGLSGSYQSAVTAAEMVMEEQNKPNTIHVVDSLTVAWPQGSLALSAAQLVKDGLSSSEVLTKIDELKSTQHVNASVKTLDNLKKGGRLSNASALLGSMLQIKPIVAMNEEGKLVPINKVRTFKKALAALIEAAQDANLDETYEIGIMQVQNIEDANFVKAELAKIYPNININVLPLSLVVSAHVGEGTIGLTWIKKAY